MHLLFLESFEALFREDSHFYCHCCIQQCVMVLVESSGLFQLDMIPALRAVRTQGGDEGAKYSMHSPPVGTEHIAQGISDKNKDMWVYKWYIIINQEVLSGIGGL